MQVAIITSVSEPSSEQLADHLIKNNIKADVFQPFQTHHYNFKNYDSVFSYGCSAETEHKHRLNTRKAVKVCIDKFETFKVFQKAGVRHPRHWNNHNNIPKDVESLVLRKDPQGRKAEDMDYWDRCDGKLVPPGYKLYSEWFPHKRELRVTVFQNQAWVYRKDLDENNVHTFLLTKSGNYSSVINHSLISAKEIGIDYVSFDVLYNSKNDYCFLEANSGSILTDEVSTAIVEYYLNKE